VCKKVEAPLTRQYGNNVEPNPILIFTDFIRNFSVADTGLDGTVIVLIVAHLLDEQAQFPTTVAHVDLPPVWNISMTHEDLLQDRLGGQTTVASGSIQTISAKRGLRNPQAKRCTKYGTAHETEGVSEELTCNRTSLFWPERPGSAEISRGSQARRVVGRSNRFGVCFAK